MTYNKVLLAGTHSVDAQFTNAYFVARPSCLRNLYLDTLTFSATPNLAALANPPIPAGYVHQSGRRSSMAPIMRSGCTA